ncbi:MAG: glycosyltransferase family 2 protein [Ferruginibacter sp.]
MEHTFPLVSVAMASFNGAKYIGEQLDTILNQTYKNVEVIIVDDCSTDDTVHIIEHYKAKYPSIRLVQNTVNTGVTKAFEKAFTYCNGVFIAIADQDDIWEKNKIEILVNGINVEDAVYSNSLLTDEKGNSLKRDFKTIMNLQSYYSGAPLLLSNCVPGHTILMKNDFVKTLFPFPGNIMFDRWIGFCAAANNGIKYIDMALVRYRQHDTNTFGTSASKNKSDTKAKQTLFQNKLAELITMASAPIKNEETKKILHEMISLFKRKWSLERSIFFFRNRELILAAKNKAGYRKFLFCCKMFFKPNF